MIMACGLPLEHCLVFAATFYEGHIYLIEMFSHAIVGVIIAVAANVIGFVLLIEVVRVLHHGFKNAYKQVLYQIVLSRSDLDLLHIALFGSEYTVQYSIMIIATSMA